MSQNLFTVSQFCEKHKCFTQGAMRWHLFNAANNGLAVTGAIIRVGRRVYIDEDLFFSWINSSPEAVNPYGQDGAA